MFINILELWSTSGKAAFRRQLFWPALVASLDRLRPSALVGNPVMLVVEIGAVAATIFAVRDGAAHSPTTSFHLQLAIWLWVTLLVANLAETVAEGRGKGRNDALREIREHTLTRKMGDDAPGIERWIYATSLRQGDVVLVQTGGVIPGDGEVIEGAGSVNESAITGESAPVIRAAGGDQSAVFGGTRVISGRLVIRISADAGATSLDQAISVIDSARRRRTRKDVALLATRIGSTVLFLLAALAPVAFALRAGMEGLAPVLVALLVCLAPTTLSAVSGAIGIAGMDRLLRHNVLTMRGHEIEAAGEADTLLFHSLGTPTPASGAATDNAPAKEARARFAELQRLGLRTVIVTSSDRQCAEALAAEAGVGDFVAEARPGTALRLVLEEQGKGHVVVMTGDEPDAPALAQADVGVAMGAGTEAAKEAASMVDLDSHFGKLTEIVAAGRQLLQTRRALTTFGIAADVAKYFAIIPAAFATTYPELRALDFMRLATPESAILSAVIFNALVIAALVPLALWGTRQGPPGGAPLLRHNLLLYGIGGLMASFVGIKLLDLLLVALGLA